MLRFCWWALVALTLACAASSASSQTKTDFSYDPLGRLIQSRDDAGRSVVYRYDAAGNRLSLGNGAAKGELLPVAFLASSKLGGAGVPTLDAMHDLTFNQAGSAHLTGADALAFITADLGAPKTLDHVDLAAPDRALTGGGIAALNDAQLQYSQDGSSWTSVSLVSGAVAGVYKTIALNGIQARYVRISKSGASVGVGDFRLYSQPKDANRAPTAVDDSRSKLNAGDSVTLDPRGNDKDLDNDVLTVTAVSPATTGQTSFTGSSVTYAPNAGYVGEDSFTYTIIDDHGGFATALVKVKSSDTPPGSSDNQDPIAVDDGSPTSRFAIPYAAGFDTPPIDVLANDSDPDGDPLTFTVSNGQKGLVDVYQGKARYFPRGGMSGPDEFTYTISDGRGRSATATVWVRIVGGDNTEPTVRPDFVDTQVGAPVTIFPLANDEDDDGDTLTISIITNPSHGQADLIDHHHVVYTPNTGFSGSDTFTYTAGDGHGGFINGMVTINVYVPVPNHPPVARNDFSADAPADIAYGASAVPFTVLDNDNDPDGDPLTIWAYSQPSGGTVNRVGNTLTYTPNAGFWGPDSFTYDIKDGKGGYAAAAVYVKVRNNPATLPTPGNDGPFHVRRGATTTFTTLLVNDTDPNGDALTIQSVGQALHGSAILVNGSTVTYGAPINYAGPERFSYTVSDASGGTGTAWVDLIIDVNEAPTARDDVADVPLNTATAISVLANDNDLNGDRLSVRGVSAPAHGSATFTSLQVTYTPAPGYVGGDRFTYTIDDNEGGSATATVTVRVAGSANQTPTAVDDGNVLVSFNTARAIDVLANDSDPDGDALTLSARTNPLHGVAVIANGKITYVPNTGYIGPDSFNYTVSDGVGVATARVDLIVERALNRPPVAVSDTGVSVSLNTAKTIYVVANDSDPDGDALTVSTVGAPAHGTATILYDRIIYTPATGYSGADSFTYVVGDGRGGSATAQVSVQVKTTPPRAPVAQNDGPIHMLRGAIVTFDNLLANDSDPDGDTLTIEEVGQAAHGLAILVNGTTVRYQSPSNYFGAERFSYTINDGSGGRATAWLDLILDLNEPPVAVDDTVRVDPNTATIINVRANDSDPNRDRLYIWIVGKPAHGTTRIDAGELVYTPTTGYTGPDSFTYTIIDNEGGSADANVTVNVTANRAPQATADSFALDGLETAKTLDVLANDSDPDGDALTVTGVTPPAQGVAFIANGRVTYVPRTGYAGVDSFGYTISDGKGGTASATVTITPPNHAPKAVNDTAFGEPGAVLNLSVLANDSDPDGDVLSIAAVTTPAHGAAAINGTLLSYTPQTGYSGPDSFGYTVSDGKGGQASATISVVVGQPNGAPVAVADGPYVTAPSTPINIPFLANDYDPDGDRVILTRVNTPAHGTATLNADGVSLDYTPAAGFTGSELFGYTINDGRGLPGNAAISVRVGAASGNTNPASRALSTANAPTEVPFNTPVTLTMPVTDPDGDPLSLSISLDAGHGVATPVPSSVQITYTPTSGYFGPDRFVYLASDGRGGFGSGSVFLRVLPDPAHRPTPANDGPYAVPFNTALTLNAVLANDTDPDGDALTIVSTSAAAHGRVAIVNGTNLVYMPTQGYSGADAFDYTVRDSHGATGVARVSLTVQTP